jgi:hypothetical protein
VLYTGPLNPPRLGDFEVGNFLKDYLRDRYEIEDSSE